MSCDWFFSVDVVFWNYTNYTKFCRLAHFRPIFAVLHPTKVPFLQSGDCTPFLKKSRILINNFWLFHGLFHGLCKIGLVCFGSGLVVCYGIWRISGCLTGFGWPVGIGLLVGSGVLLLAIFGRSGGSCWRGWAFGGRGVAVRACDEVAIDYG